MMIVTSRYYSVHWLHEHNRGETLYKFDLNHVNRVHGAPGFYIHHPPKLYSSELIAVK